MISSWKMLAAFGFGLGIILVPDMAPAQPYPTYRGERRYEDNTVTRRPPRGYTGWGSGPLRDYFCDFQRTPIRRCNNGRCRVVAWEFRQYCY